MTDDEHALRAQSEPSGRAEETKRITRILLLIALIRDNPRRWTRAALSRRLEIGERQLDKDLQILRHGLHCELGHGRDGYYFTRLPELLPIRYTAPEALALLTALQVARDSGALDQAGLAAALARTEGALPAGFLPVIRSLQGSTTRPSAARQHRAAMLVVLQTALKEQRNVAVLYETASRGGERSERILQPYHLQLRGQTWLVTAHDSLRAGVRDFVVDRIVRAELLDAHYQIPSDFDPEEYRGSGWGLLRGESGPPVHVELRVGAEEARRLRDEMHHPSQRAEQQADGTWRVTYDTSLSPELVRWVFRWGAGCEVLAPPELRAMVAKMARRIVEINA